MTDFIDIFLGDLKCKLQMFRPKPDDVFIITIPGEISFEEEKRLKSCMKELFPENRAAVLTSGATVDLDTEMN